jgi:hypothetical protein
MYLCKYMPEPKDSRRQIPDPDHEPEFEAISRLYPVPPPNLLVASATMLSAATSTALSSSFNTSVAAPPSTISVLLHAPAVTEASSSLNNILAAMREHQPSGAAPLAPPKGGLDRHTALAEMQSLRARLAAEAAASPSPAAPPLKIGMDRDAALAEIKSLRARLASEVVDAEGMEAPMTESAPKRVALDSEDAPMQQLARMPQPFPTRAKTRDASSQIETFLQRNMIVATMRKEQESQKQLEEQLQHPPPSYPTNIQALSDAERLQFLQRQQQQQQSFATNPSNFSHSHPLPGNATDLFANPMNNPLFERNPFYAQQQEQPPPAQPTNLLPPGTTQWNVPNRGGLRSHPSHGSRTPGASNTNATNDLVGEYLRGSSGRQHFS